MTVAALMQPLQYTIYEIQLQKTIIVLRMQPRHEATLTQPLQCDLQRLSCKTQSTTRNSVGNCSSKTGSRRQSDKKTILKHFLKRIFKKKTIGAKIEKICWQMTVAALMQPLQYTIYEIQLQKTIIVLRMQPRHEATLTQPLQCDLQRLSCKTQSTTRNSVGNCSSKTGSRRQSDKKTILKHFLKRIFKKKTIGAKIEKICWQNNTRTPDDKSHAAIPMRSASTDSKTPYNYAHTSTPKAAWSHRYNAEKKKANRPQPQPPHRRGTFHRRLQPLYTEKHKVSCSGFLPKT